MGRTLPDDQSGMPIFMMRPGYCRHPSRRPPEVRAPADVVDAWGRQLSSSGGSCAAVRKVRSGSEVPMSRARWPSRSCPFPPGRPTASGSPLTATRAPPSPSDDINRRMKAAVIQVRKALLTAPRLAGRRSAPRPWARESATDRPKAVVRLTRSKRAHKTKQPATHQAGRTVLFCTE